jgi:nucleotide-binding universal stress UspA family protein
VEIISTAKQNNVDMLVLGTHGRTGLAHMMLGSVSEKVVRKAPCPVLTVRQPNHKFVMP